jgi:hypothetical protein
MAGLFGIRNAIRARGGDRAIEYAKRGRALSDPHYPPPFQSQINQTECHTASGSFRGIQYMIAFAKQSVLFATQ